MTRTFFKEMQGHIRGNKRLRRRVDALKARVQWLEMWIGALVMHADNNGHGDDQVVANAAGQIGWNRLPPAEVERIKDAIRAMW